MRPDAKKRTGLRTPVSCAVYYSDGQFHASGVTANLTQSGGCLRGTHPVAVGMTLTLLVIPPTQNALLIKRATVRWTKAERFGFELDAQDLSTGRELDLVAFDQAHIPLSLMTH